MKDHKICQDNVNTKLRELGKNLKSFLLFMLLMIIKTRKPDKKSVGLLDNKSTERELNENKATAERHYELSALVFIAKHIEKIPKPRPFPGAEK